VVGDGDGERFREHAQRAGVAANVRFFGRRADAERFYQAADIFVLPTLYEAHPLVVQEAAASALPLVTTAVNGVEDLLAGGRAGIAVTRDGASVGAALTRLAADADLRRRLGTAGRETASGYRWQRSVSSVLGMYRSLLGERT
jgi:glycosyltransferase involved in cell wall biosynthesis